MIYHGTNFLKKDSFFIRKRNTNLFLHPPMARTEFPTYLFLNGFVGACIWASSEANELVNYVREENPILDLELVKVTHLIKDTHSSN